MSVYGEYIWDSYRKYIEDLPRCAIAKRWCALFKVERYRLLAYDHRALGCQL